MRFLPRQLRHRATRRKKIQLMKVDRALWAWSCPWCHVWGEGVVWGTVAGHMFRHVDLIHRSILKELNT